MLQDFSKERARRFRDKAEELRAAASTVGDEQCRSMLLQIAQDYDNIAEAAELRAHAPATVCPIAPPRATGVSASRPRREAS